MAKIIRSKDCGNSPKNQLVEDLAVALLSGDLQTASALTTEDVQWHTADGNALHGREALLEEVDKTRSFLQLTVLHAVTHGRSGAVNGEIQTKRSAEGFCFVFEFANIKGTSVRQITAYHRAI
ncbi:MAG: nuclear transport factor 2 family protein [Ardenticatenaceae bacterium]|nr:nuclear transport factor 2 family protein [Ardenticatenaceae bacterium]